LQDVYLSDIKEISIAKTISILVIVYGYIAQFLATFPGTLDRWRPSHRAQQELTGDNNAVTATEARSIEQNPVRPGSPTGISAAPTAANALNSDATAATAKCHKPPALRTLLSQAPALED